MGAPQVLNVFSMEILAILVVGTLLKATGNYNGHPIIWNSLLNCYKGITPVPKAVVISEESVFYNRQFTSTALSSESDDSGYYNGIF